MQAQTLPEEADGETKFYVACASAFPAALERPPFNQPAVREFWEARRDLLAWEQREDIRSLLDEIERMATASNAYFRTMDMVAIANKPPEFFAGLDKATQKFVREQYAIYQQNLGAPEAYVQAVIKLQQAGGIQTIDRVLVARKALEAAMPRLRLDAVPGRDPLAVAAALEWQMHEVSTLHCAPPIRVFGQKSLAPMPSAAALPTPAVPQLRQMYNSGAKSLVDNLSQLSGFVPVEMVALPSGFHVAMQDFAQRIEPQVVALIGTLSEADLKSMNERLTQGWNTTGRAIYDRLGDRPAIKAAMAERKTSLLGLAGSDAQLSLAEKKRRNLAPSVGELLALVADHSFLDTKNANNTEFVRTGTTTFDDYVNSPFTGRTKNGESRVEILDPQCRPLGNRHECSFTHTIAVQEFVFGRPGRAYGTGFSDVKIVVYWGPNGLQSDDLRKVALGWVRSGSARPSGSSGASRGDENAKDREYTRERSQQEADAREQARADERRRIDADQEERRRRNRSCGPAPNICN